MAKTKSAVDFSDWLMDGARALCCMNGGLSGCKRRSSVSGAIYDVFLSNLKDESGNVIVSVS